MAKATCRGCGCPIDRVTGYRYSRCGPCAYQYRKAYNENGRPVTECQSCGSVLPPGRSKYCSDECSGKWLGPVDRHLFTCAGPTCHNLCVSSHQRARYCSDRCKQALDNVKRLGVHRAVTARPHWVMSQPVLGPTRKSWPRYGPHKPPAMPVGVDRRCASCGEMMFDVHRSRKRHPECARRHNIARLMELYETAYKCADVKRAMGWRKQLVQYLRERDGDKCALCSRVMDFESTTGARGNSDDGATVDHIHPRSLGGGNEPENLQLAHWSCNRAKGNRGEPEQLRLTG